MNVFKFLDPYKDEILNELQSFQSKYLKEVLDYVGISEDKFNKLCDEFRSPHIWKKNSNGYFLRHTVNKDGVDD